MPLSSGTRVAGYEVVAPLGAGGMGEVYRARDTRLARDVAIKILAPHIASDRDAVVRFEREARALAALNHPNIAAIYDVIDAGGQPALVLELVEGETLADRVAIGRLPIDLATAYARQIADALDAAHEAGIVHRDLKPGNIKVTEDGRIKVLDFGLAKAVAIAAGQPPDADPSHSPTVTVHGISQNVILGTAAYMSPEQARGKRIDKRTDIWAFGCVVFEMLTGRRAFSGETTSDVIAAIIERSPDLTLLPAATPPHLRRVIERCLEKDPKRRARDIGDVRSELDRVDVAPTKSSRTRPLMATAVLLIAVAAGVAGWRWRPAPAPPPLIEFTIAAPPGHSLVPQAAALSPDGTQLAFLVRDERQVQSIWVRSIDNATPRRVNGTEGAANVPVWSPDGRALAFFVSGVWKRISVDDGQPVTIVADVPANLGASWGTNDVLLLAPANRTWLSRVPVTGGALQQVTKLDTAKENSHRWPQMLPDGRHFLFTVRSDSPERLGIKLGALDSPDVRSLVNVASPGVYVEPGRLLYVTPDKVLMAQPIDPATWTLQGAPAEVAGPVVYFGPSFSAAFDASLDGRVIVYQPAARSESTLEWFDRSGKSLGRAAPERPYLGVRLAPDQRQAIVELADPQIGTRDLWLADTERATLTRFTSHTATDWRAVFSPDGSSIAFASDRAGASTIFRARANGTDEPTVMYRNENGGVFSYDWTRDGKHLFVGVDDAQGRPREVLLVPVDGGAPKRVGAGGTGNFNLPRLSPTGDLVAYTSRSSMTTEVEVMSVTDGARVRISADGGSNPMWGPEGELFYYHAQHGIMRARVRGTTMVEKPAPMFQPCASVGRRFNAGSAEFGYDITEDGTRFVMICGSNDTAPSMTVIVNWQNKLQ